MFLDEKSVLQMRGRIAPCSSRNPSPTPRLPLRQEDDRADHRAGGAGLQQPRGHRHRAPGRRPHHLACHHHSRADDHQDPPGRYLQVSSRLTRCADVVLFLVGYIYFIYFILFFIFFFYHRLTTRPLDSFYLSRSCSSKTLVPTISTCPAHSVFARCL